LSGRRPQRRVAVAAAPPRRRAAATAVQAGQGPPVQDRVGLGTRVCGVPGRWFRPEAGTQSVVPHDHGVEQAGRRWAVSEDRRLAVLRAIVED